MYLLQYWRERKEGRSHGWEDNRRALFTIHINMWTVSSDDSIQRRHWQPLSVHLWAYSTHPTRDVNDVGRNNNDIHNSTHLSGFLYCLYSRSHRHRQSTIVLDHECMWRFASYYWNIAWGFRFLCTALFLCKTKWKTFNPVTPKRAPQHKSTKISNVIQKKNSEKQDTDVCKNTAGVFHYIIAPWDLIQGYKILKLTGLETSTFWCFNGVLVVFQI